jgi:hypothetical protein
MSKNQREEFESDFNASKKIKGEDDNQEIDENEVINDDDGDETVLKSDEFEAFYGIKQRINQNFERFNGSIKTTIGDFIVNEIDLDENVIKLTNFNLPVTEIVQSTEKNENELEQNVCAVFLY